MNCSQNLPLNAFLLSHTLCLVLFPNWQTDNGLFLSIDFNTVFSLHGIQVYYIVGNWCFFLFKYRYKSDNLTHTKKSRICVECLVFFFLRWIAVIGLCGEKNIGSPIVMVIDCDRNTTKKKNTTQDTELYTQYLNNTRCETQQPFTIYLLQNFTFSSVITKFPQQDIVLIKYRLAKKKKNKLQARWTVNLYSLSKCDFVTIYNANNDVTFALFKLPMI